MAMYLPIVLIMLPGWLGFKSSRLNYISAKSIFSVLSNTDNANAGCNIGGACWQVQGQTRTIRVREDWTGNRLLQATACSGDSIDPDVNKCKRVQTCIEI
ncbi:hypothetical protein V8C37DRAFT_363654 [Trichoderma ceciliae]